MRNNNLNDTNDTTEEVSYIDPDEVFHDKEKVLTESMKKRAVAQLRGNNPHQHTEHYIEDLFVWTYSLIENIRLIRGIHIGYDKVLFYTKKLLEYKYYTLSHRNKAELYCKFADWKYHVKNIVLADFFPKDEDIKHIEKQDLIVMTSEQMKHFLRRKERDIRLQWEIEQAEKNKHTTPADTMYKDMALQYADVLERNDQITALLRSKSDEIQSLQSTLKQQQEQIEQLLEQLNNSETDDVHTLPENSRKTA